MSDNLTPSRVRRRIEESMAQTNWLGAFLMNRVLQTSSQKRGKRTRAVYSRTNYKESGWWKMLEERSCEDPSSKAGKLFRLRFRVPFPIFRKMTLLASLWFPKADTDSSGRPSVPIELLVLGVLRILGRGICFDDVQELCGVDKETLRTFFHEFCERFALELYDEHVHPPRTEEELSDALRVFELIGFPGALGSVDCTHISWDRCPAGEFNSHKGAKGRPTRMFQLTCSHTNFIYAVTRSNAGCMNDKTAIKFDKFVQNLRTDPFFTERSFRLTLSDGSETTEKGVYLLCDGGYMGWRVLQAPLKHTWVPKEVLWSSRLESARKDVECTFGRLKGRFRILKLPFNFSTAEKLDNVVFTCAILHNMILTFDGLDRRWEEECNWEAQTGDHGDLPDEPDIVRPQGYAVRTRDESGHVSFGRQEAAPSDDFTGVGVGVNAVEDDSETESSHRVLQAKLIDHFYHKWSLKQILWLG